MAANDGEVVCGACFCPLNRSDMNCWRCGSVNLRRGEVTLPLPEGLVYWREEQQQPPPQPPLPTIQGSGPMWRPGGGPPVPVASLDTKHLENIVEYFSRKGRMAPPEIIRELQSRRNQAQKQGGPATPATIAKPTPGIQGLVDDGKVPPKDVARKIQERIEEVFTKKAMKKV